jgi:hypothetical protein
MFSMVSIPTSSPFSVTDSAQPGYPILDESEEGQKREKGPVHPHVYARESSYLESTAR